MSKLSCSPLASGSASGPIIWGVSDGRAVGACGRRACRPRSGRRSAARRSASTNLAGARLRASAIQCGIRSYRALRSGPTPRARPRAPQHGLRPHQGCARRGNAHHRTRPLCQNHHGLRKCQHVQRAMVTPFQVSGHRKQPRWTWQRPQMSDLPACCWAAYLRPIADLKIRLVSAEGATDATNRLRSGHSGSLTHPRRA
jgi:hypothetical protein